LGGTGGQYAAGKLYRQNRRVKKLKSVNWRWELALSISSDIPAFYWRHGRETDSQRSSAAGCSQ